VLDAAGRLARQGILQPILIGPSPERAPEGVTFIDPAAHRWVEIRRDLTTTPPREGNHAGGSRADRAPSAIFASLMVAAGDADGSVGGAVNTTAETVRARCKRWTGRWRAARFERIIMLCRTGRSTQGLLAFADCAIVIEPTPSQLAEIAIASAESTRTLIGAEPTSHCSRFRLKAAESTSKWPDSGGLRIVRERAPNLHVDGSCKPTRPWTPWWAARRRRDRPWRPANTLIFPNLASANIGYKLVERLGGASAIGPFCRAWRSLPTICRAGARGRCVQYGGRTAIQGGS